MPFLLYASGKLRTETLRRRQMKSLTKTDILFAFLLGCIVMALPLMFDQDLYFIDDMQAYFVPGYLSIGETLLTNGSVPSLTLQTWMGGFIAGEYQHTRQGFTGILKYWLKRKINQTVYRFHRRRKLKDSTVKSDKVIVRGEFKLCFGKINNEFFLCLILVSIQIQCRGKAAGFNISKISNLLRFDF